MSKRPIGAITFDLWDCLFHDDSDEPKRTAAGLPPKPRARRDLLYTLLSKHGPVDRVKTDLAFDVQDAAFRKVWHDQHVTWSVTERMTVLLDGLGAKLPEDDFKTLVEALETMELEYRPNPAPGAVEALARLHGRWPLAIVSDAIFTPGRNLRVLLRDAGMLEHFDYFVFSDEIGHSKPHPAV
jgi:putative hydrolase of the HAD superfamily